MDMELTKRLTQELYKAAETEALLQAREHYKTDRGLRTYSSWLPEIPEAWGNTERASQNWVVAHVAQLLCEKRESGRAEKLRIVDLGCGEAKALSELAQKLAVVFFEGSIEALEEEIELIGVSYTDYRHDGIGKPGVDYRIGNMIHLDRLLGDEPVDFFMAVQSIRYVKPAAMRALVLETMYNMLRDGGIATVRYSSLIETTLGADEENTFPQAIRVAFENYYNDLNQAWANAGLRIQADSSAVYVYDLNGDLVMQKQEGVPFSMPLQFDSNGNVDIQIFNERYLDTNVFSLLGDSLHRSLRLFFRFMRNEMTDGQMMSTEDIGDYLWEIPQELLPLILQEVDGIFTSINPRPADHKRLQNYLRDVRATIIATFEDIYR